MRGIWQFPENEPDPALHEQVQRPEEEGNSEHEEPDGEEHDLFGWESMAAPMKFPEESWGGPGVRHD